MLVAAGQIGARTPWGEAGGGWYAARVYVQRCLRKRGSPNLVLAPSPPGSMYGPGLGNGAHFHEHCSSFLCSH